MELAYILYEEANKVEIGGEESGDSISANR